ncbi:hypothetical protein PIB30_041041 [Stylosanthes scabra]|uniref:Uncharacterized protein n=1 Tax=Stylosanthes scabra TaxID=79078 RepID=A0ABU6SEZ3_9FABA|nr:hypothetical protein [Stylosanthes scabra]
MKGCSSRACDSCLRVRARWFCAADDAFLCHGCDNLVHSANQLASRHERVRLQASSASSSSKMMMIRTIAATEAEAEGQAWCSGFTRKARTPRHNNKNYLVQQQQQEEGKDDEEEGVFINYHSSMFLPVVPELGSEDQMLLDDYETEDQMLCRVPVFDPFDDDSELCSVYNEVKKKKQHKKKKNNDDADAEGEVPFGLENFSELLPRDDVDLSEFAADVENLLDIEDGVEIKEEHERDNDDNKGATRMIKVKDELLQVTKNNDDDCNLESILNWNIDSSKSMMVGVVEHEEEEEEEENNKVPVMVASGGNSNSSEVEIKKKERLLRLNYEEVISAWASQGSPWTTPNPPNFNFVDDCWPHCLGSSSGGLDGEVRNIIRWNEGGGVVDDGGREARVSRYREKRRTRLFAKKIRYEVRKLNAEKRPRMKGRFVKRTSSSSSSSFVGGAISAASFPPHQFPLTSN